MALVEKTLFGTIDKVARSIERIKHFEPPEGYYLAFSGGKDSIVIHKLAEMAGVKFTAHYNYTGLDPIELVNFVKQEYPKVIFNYPIETYGKAWMREAFPPMSGMRWCCRILKESQGTGWIMIGIRSAESAKRSKKKKVEPCPDKQRVRFAPILDWETGDVWAFIRKHNLLYPALYDHGYTRLGCLLCPEKSEWMRRRDVEKFPKYANMWRVLFKRLYAKRKAKGMDCTWGSSEEWMEWWLTRPPKKEIEGQCYLFDN